MFLTLPRTSPVFGLLSLFLLICTSSAHTCVHDQVQIEQTFMEFDYGPDAGRNLAGATYQSIRIYLDYSNLTNSGMDSGFIDYISNTLLPPAMNWMQAALNVKRLASNIIITDATVCSNIVTVPASYKTTGVAADLVIFVTTTNEPTQTFVAYAGSCTLDSTTKRPVIGRLNYNTAKVAVSTLEATIERDITVSMHELTHVLGFSYGLFQYYIDPNTNAVLTGHYPTRTINGQTIIVLILPTLQSKLRTYFNCSTLEGAYIEQEGSSGSAGSHFERRVFYNEYMTASVIKEVRISQFTLALLEGTGWYTVNYSMAEPMTWGQSQNCSFLNTFCMASGSPQFQEFCSPLGAIKPTWAYRGIGTCVGLPVSTNSSLASYLNYWGNNTIVSDVFADNCPTTNMYTNLDCEAPENQATAFLGTAETYAAGSKGFIGTLSPGDALAFNYGFCFPATCETISGAQRIKLIVNGGAVYCNGPGNIIVSGFNGYLTCPTPATFCPKISSEGYCRRMCSGRGDCTNKACVCYPGWGSHDCSKRVYTDNTAACVNVVNQTSSYGDGCACNPTNLTCCATNAATCIYPAVVNSNSNSVAGIGNLFGLIKNGKLDTSGSNIAILIGLVIGGIVILAVIICILGKCCGSSKPEGQQLSTAKVAPSHMLDTIPTTPIQMRTWHSTQFDHTLTNFDSESPTKFQTRSPFRRPQQSTFGEY